MNCKHIVMNSGLKMLLDDVDYNYFINFTIHSTKDGYAVYTLNGKKTYVHRTIAGAKDGEIVDHKNRDTLDNRRENLRVTSHSMNHGNVEKYNIKNPTSKYKGVFFDKANQNWVCKVGFHQKQYFNGRFSNELAAAHAYNYYATKAFGEFALVNKLPYRIEWRKYQLVRKRIQKQSGYKYISWDDSKGKWVGYVTKNGQQEYVYSGLSKIEVLIEVNQFILDNNLHKLKKYKKNLQMLLNEDIDMATEDQLLILKRQMEENEYEINQD